MKSFIISGPVYKLMFSGIEELSALEELDIAHNMLVDHQCLLPLLKFRKLMIVSDQLTLHALMDSSLWFDTINYGWSIVYIEGSQVILSNKIVFLSLKIVLV